MPAVAAIAPAAPAAPAAATPAAAAAGKPAPFHLQLDDPARDADQAASPATPPRPGAADGKPPSAKAADKQPGATATAEPGPPAWLMAMLGGSAAPVQDAAASAVNPGAAADDGMPAPTIVTGATASAAKPLAKAGGAAAAAVQPLPAAAGPAAPPSPPAADAKDGDAAAAGIDAAVPATPQAAAPVPHEAVPAHAAPADAPPPAVPSHTQAVTDATANLQSFARVLDAAGGNAGAPAAAPHAALNTAHAEWPQALADQVQWQLGHEVQEARLELHPRDLGTVQVQVRITSEGAEVRFAASHPQAREALQAALPQLRSLLQGDGIALAQSQVGAQSSWQAPAQPQRQPQARPGAAAPAADEEPAAAAPRVVRVGLVDDFA
jgi:flagellar hook-length control protein FliK